MVCGIHSHTHTQATLRTKTHTQTHRLLAIHAHTYTRTHKCLCLSVNLIHSATLLQVGSRVAIYIVLVVTNKLRTELIVINPLQNVRSRRLLCGKCYSIGLSKEFEKSRNRCIISMKLGMLFYMHTTGQCSIVLWIKHNLYTIY